MGYIYGIKQAREALLKLSTNESLYQRLIGAGGEIGVITAQDVSPEHFKEIDEWRKSYFAIDRSKEAEIKSLAESLVWLCVEIIERNAKSN